MLGGDGIWEHELVHVEFTIAFSRRWGFVLVFFYSLAGLDLLHTLFHPHPFLRLEHRAGLFPRTCLRDFGLLQRSKFV